MRIHQSRNCLQFVLASGTAAFSLEFGRSLTLPDWIPASAGKTEIGLLRSNPAIALCYLPFAICYLGHPPGSGAFPKFGIVAAAPA